MWENNITMTTASNTSGTYVTVDGSIFSTGFDRVVTVNPWTFNGIAQYDERINGNDYIKVDKGSPDKAKYVIFYAVNKKDPMIFCKTRKQLLKELKKLSKREDVDMKSVRWFR